MTYYFIDDFDNICRQKDGMDKDFAEVIDLIELINDTNKIQEENEQLKLLIKKVLETTPIEHSLALDLKNSIRELYK